MKLPLTFRRMWYMQQVSALEADYRELCAVCEALSESRQREIDLLASHITFLQAQVVDDQRAIRQIATDARDALEAGVDIIPGLEKMIEVLNRSIANLEEHLEVTTVVNL